MEKNRATGVQIYGAGMDATEVDRESLASLTSAVEKI